jgi:hypothetical protein
LRNDPDLTAQRQRIEHDVERAPDKVLGFTSLMPLLYGQSAMRAQLHACPMHPEITAAEPTTCPKCGMKLVPSDSVTLQYRCRTTQHMALTIQATVSSGRT